MKLKKLVQEWKNYKDGGQLIEYYCSCCESPANSKLGVMMQARSNQEKSEQHDINK